MTERGPFIGRMGRDGWANSFSGAGEGRREDEKQQKRRGAVGEERQSRQEGIGSENKEKGANPRHGCHKEKKQKKNKKGMEHRPFVSWIVSLESLFCLDLCLLLSVGFWLVSVRVFTIPIQKALTTINDNNKTNNSGNKTIKSGWTNNRRQNR